MDDLTLVIQPVDFLDAERANSMNCPIVHAVRRQLGIGKPTFVGAGLTSVTIDDRLYTNDATGRRLVRLWDAGRSVEEIFAACGVPIALHLTRGFSGERGT